jgi:hypothetical protein
MAYIPVTNQSVSGTIGAQLESTNASVISVIKGSVAVAFSAAANQSVSGTVDIGVIPGSVIAQIASSVLVAGTVTANQGTGFGSVAATIVGGSTIALLGNTSVVSLEGAGWSGSVAAHIKSGSVIALLGNTSVVAVASTTWPGSVVAFQGTSQWITSIIGIPSISGTVRAVQQTDPWKVDLDKIAGASTAVSGGTEATALRVTIASDTSGPGSVAAHIKSGSVIALLGNTSVVALEGAGWSGSVAAMIKAGSVIAVLGGNTSVVAIQGTTEWTVKSSVAGGIFPISGSVAATITNTNLNVGGSVVAFQGAGWSGSVLSVESTANPGSVATHIKSGSVIALMGNTSIVAVQGTWSGSVIAQIASSVLTIITSKPSISGRVDVGSIVGGTYAGDTTAAQLATGFLTFGQRNDTLASIISADSKYGPTALGPSGENIVANAPLTKWVQGVASCFTGVIQPVIAAQGASVFTYITGIQVANDSANYSRMTIYGGTDSVIGYLPVPASGGVVVQLLNPLKSKQNAIVSASITGVSSVYVTMEGFISKS